MLERIATGRETRATGRKVSVENAVAKARTGQIGACGGWGDRYGAPSLVGMHFPQFLRIEREGPGISRHTVVHLRSPKFWLELAPDAAAQDRVGRGVLKRICVPNSWAGDYQKYFRLVGAAQRFFAASFGAAAPKSVTRRLEA